MATLHAKIREIQRINQRELDQGTPDRASWHTQYKKSAYIFVGNLPFELNEGDIIQMFSQWGEIVDCNLIRDNPMKGGGKSRGFAFVAYEDQRSTVLAVDNFNGTNLQGRDLHVDHVLRYRKPKNLKKGDSASGGVGDVEEDDETYEKRRQMIWDYRKYRNCRPPHGVKDEIVARNEGQKKLKEKKSDLQKQIQERRQRRQKQRREQGERMAFRKPDQITQEPEARPAKLTFDEEIRLMAKKTKKKKKKRKDDRRHKKRKKRRRERSSS